MENQAYLNIRAKIERELERVDDSSTPSNNRLLACQYVTGLIDAVDEIDPLCASYLKNIKTSYLNAWAAE
jgi:hypothetical protein